MKNYYIRYPRNFANEYDLVWIDAADTESIREASEAGYERITRKSAYAKIAYEKWRRKTDRSFSGFAPVVILPYRLDLPNIPDLDEWETHFELHDVDSGILRCCTWHGSASDRDIRMYSDDRIVFEAVK